MLLITTPGIVVTSYSVLGTESESSFRNGPQDFIPKNPQTRQCITNCGSLFFRSISIAVEFSYAGRDCLFCDLDVLSQFGAIRLQNGSLVKPSPRGSRLSYSRLLKPRDCHIPFLLISRRYNCCCMEGLLEAGFLSFNGHPIGKSPTRGIFADVHNMLSGQSRFLITRRHNVPFS